MDMSEDAASVPGPCYPNWPSTNGAFVNHRMSDAVNGYEGCKRCGMYVTPVVRQSEGSDG